MRYLLSPFAVIYFFLITLREILYKIGIFRTYRSPLPVICVGNITLGGTGKTPVTLWLCQQLISKGYKPCILSRGYGGQIRDVHLVNASADTAEMVGDETLLLAQLSQVPVVIAPKRAKGARWIEQHLDVSLIIMDDGFQHFGLFRNFNILCFDAQKSACEYSLLPIGRMREAWGALARAHHVVVTKVESPHLPTVLETHLASMDQSHCRYQISLSSEEPLSRVILVSGIANPDFFERLGNESGFQVVKHKIFNDHYMYRVEDIKDLEEEAISIRAKILCTEKDWVKIKHLGPQDGLWCHSHLKLEWIKGENELVEKAASFLT